jgi:hypothetical protein
MLLLQDIVIRIVCEVRISYRAVIVRRIFWTCLDRMFDTKHLNSLRQCQNFRANITSVLKAEGHILYADLPTVSENNLVLHFYGSSDYMFIWNLFQRIYYIQNSSFDK